MKFVQRIKEIGGAILALGLFFAFVIMISPALAVLGTGDPAAATWQMKQLGLDRIDPQVFGYSFLALMSASVIAAFGWAVYDSMH